MTSREKGVGDGIAAMLRRLNDFAVQWRAARASYFEPAGFRRALQAAITTSRTVTFIVQSNKSAIPKFDEWYLPWTTKWGADPVMQWAKNARNKIEKQGDLETLSQLQVALFSGYLSGPVSNWIPENVLFTLGDIRRTIPKKYLDDHFIENGFLTIERRWVDIELPEYELLDALSLVYGQFVLLLVDLHRHLGALIPAKVRGRSHILLDVNAEGRPADMTSLGAERRITISAKTGAIIELNATSTSSPSEKRFKEVKKHYGKKPPLEGLQNATTLSEVAESYFNTARQVILRDHYHIHLIVLMHNLVPVKMIRTKPSGRGEKYLLMKKIAEDVRELDADAILYIAETWIASEGEVPPSGFAADAPNRREGLALSAASKDGLQLELFAEIERKKVKKHKVKRLGATKREDGGILMMFAPVYQVWGRMDLLRLDDETLHWPGEAN